MARKPHALEEKPFDYIERTKPEDSMAGTSQIGQLTRDNVNPNIPSAPQEEAIETIISPNEPPGQTKRERARHHEDRLRGFDPRNPNAPKRGETTGPNPAPPPEHPVEGEAMGTTRPIFSPNEPPGSDIAPPEVPKDEPKAKRETKAKKDKPARKAKAKKAKGKPKAKKAKKAKAKRK